MRSEDLRFPEFGTAPVNRTNYVLKECPMTGEREMVQLRTPFMLKSKWDTIWWLTQVLYNVGEAFDDQTTKFLYNHLKGDEFLEKFVKDRDDPECVQQYLRNCKRIAAELLRYVKPSYVARNDNGDSLIRLRRAISKALQLNPFELAMFILTSRSQMNAVTQGQCRCLPHESHVLLAQFKLEQEWSWFSLSLLDLLPVEVGLIMKEAFEEKGMKFYDSMPLFTRNYEAPKSYDPITREDTPEEFLFLPKGALYCEKATKTPVCHHCNKPGHIRPKCRILHKRSARKGDDLNRKRQKTSPA